MIVLDTNVLSETMRLNPERRVLNWLAQNSTAGLTAISVGEVLRGVASMPDGVRRQAFSTAVLQALDDITEVLPYDEAAAHVFAEICQMRKRTGRPLATEDGMIAAICISRGATLATRNTKDFADLGMDLLNPWD